MFFISTSYYLASNLKANYFVKYFFYMSDRLIDRLKLFERYSTELSKILNSINIGDHLAQDPLVDNLPHNRYLLPEEIIPVNDGLFRLANWNCCGVLSSLDFLSTFLPDSGIEVMGLYDTFLNANTLNAANIQGYQILQKIDWIIRKEDLHSTSILLCILKKSKILTLYMRKCCSNCRLSKSPLHLRRFFYACFTTLLVLAPRNIWINLKNLLRWSVPRKEKSISWGTLTLTLLQ